MVPVIKRTPVCCSSPRRDIFCLYIYLRRCLIQQSARSSRVDKSFVSFRNGDYDTFSKMSRGFFFFFLNKRSRFLSLKSIFCFFVFRIFENTTSRFRLIIFKKYSKNPETEIINKCIYIYIRNAGGLRQ